MRLGVETPLSRGVVRKDSVGVREAPSRACWRRTLGTWQVLRGVEGCVLPAGVPPAVVIAGTGRHVARVCWKGETVLEESLTVLAELYAFLRQCWQNWTAPMAVFPSLTHLRLIALRSSLAIGVSSFSPFWAILMSSPRKVPVAPGDSIISFQIFWYYSCPPRTFWCPNPVPGPDGFIGQRIHSVLRLRATRC